MTNWQQQGNDSTVWISDGGTDGALLANGLFKGMGGQGSSHGKAGLVALGAGISRYTLLFIYQVLTAVELSASLAINLI